MAGIYIVIEILGQESDVESDGSAPLYLLVMSRGGGQRVPVWWGGPEGRVNKWGRREITR